MHLRNNAIQRRCLIAEPLVLTVLKELTALLNSTLLRTDRL